MRRMSPGSEKKSQAQKVFRLEFKTRWSCKRTLHPKQQVFLWTRSILDLVNRQILLQWDGMSTGSFCIILPAWPYAKQIKPAYAGKLAGLNCSYLEARDQWFILYSIHSYSNFLVNYERKKRMHSHKRRFIQSWASQSSNPTTTASASQTSNYEVNRVSNQTI